ncbi:hypothetical protein HPP92_022480 [Vanilla planifolia]|uniref:Tetrapyrrole biosynthesis uroporphyrinogen III synthase domain-containing protein n=1 Tax=Vanilla planifolia TaxID=51239 RepID=A0A835UC83_VANPL|nr:hypothetical protein HPP92_022771 [Vanilla planifolia]KAG0459352.1 hypothetical protein HPP92_022480 [Vanilla planifolia]
MKTLTAATLIRPQVTPTAAAAAAVQNPLSNRHVAFTTPPFYGERLASLLHHRGAVPVPIPTVIVEPIPRTIAALRPFICSEELGRFSSLLFTSRTGISAIALALDDAPPPLSDSGEPFIIAALGRDAEHLHELGLIHKLCRSRHRIQVIDPKVASPSGLVEALGEGFGRRALCPVPDVVGLEEPPVVPDFLKALEASGWVPTRVPAYETRWAGPKCAEELVGEAELETLDAIVFTSTTEVEGLMKSLEAMGWGWSAVIEKRPRMLVATHGPVTANGAQRFGVAVDVVSSSFSSFNGVLDALAVRWADSCEQQ